MFLSPAKDVRGRFEACTQLEQEWPDYGPRLDIRSGSDTRRVLPVDVGQSCLESFDLAAGIEKVGEHAPVLENFEADPIVTGEAFFGTKRKRPTLPGEPGEVASRNGILEQCLDGLEIAHGI